MQSESCGVSLAVKVLIESSSKKVRHTDPGLAVGYATFGINPDWFGKGLSVKMFPNCYSIQLTFVKNVQCSSSSLNSSVLIDCGQFIKCIFYSIDALSIKLHYYAAISRHIRLFQNYFLTLCTDVQKFGSQLHCIWWLPAIIHQKSKNKLCVIIIFWNYKSPAARKHNMSCAICGACLWKIIIKCYFPFFGRRHSCIKWKWKVQIQSFIHHTVNKQTNKHWHIHYVTWKGRHGFLALTVSNMMLIDICVWICMYNTLSDCELI